MTSLTNVYSVHTNQWNRNVVFHFRSGVTRKLHLLLQHSANGGAAVGLSIPRCRLRHGRFLRQQEEARQRQERLVILLYYDNYTHVPLICKVKHTKKCLFEIS